MPTVSGRNRRALLTRGFTLIEILVVIVIIAIVVGTVSVNLMRDERQSLQDEADRLAALLQHARDQATLTGRPIGWAAEAGKYAFLEMNTDGKWSVKANDEVLRERELPASIKWRELRISGQEAKLGDVIIFSNAGLNLPFDLTMELSGHTVLVQGDPLGRVTVSRPPPPT